jgi:hypothetical protein
MPNQSALEDEFPEANQEEIADLMAQIKDDYPLQQVIKDRKEAARLPWRGRFNAGTSTSKSRIKISIVSRG